MLHESLLISVLAYGSEVIIWRENEWSRIGAVHMDNLRGLLAIIRMDKVPNALIRELCGVTKGVDEKTDESVLRWLGHVEIMENDKITKKLYVGESAGSSSVSRPRIDITKDCLKKMCLDVKQARIMVHDRSA